MATAPTTPAKPQRTSHCLVSSLLPTAATVRRRLGQVKECDKAQYGRLAAGLVDQGLGQVVADDDGEEDGV
jgi:hypothetical protein